MGPDLRVYLSHAKLNGHYTIRVVVGNPRATEDHVRTCWEILRAAAERVTP